MVICGVIRGQCQVIILDVVWSLCDGCVEAV